MSRRVSVLLLVVVVAAFALAWRFGALTAPGVTPPAALVETSPPPATGTASPAGPAPTETASAGGPSASSTPAPGVAGSDAGASAGAAQTGVAAIAPGEGTASGSEPQAGTPAAPVPSFDVVRVEPDGSAVIAGRAAPGETVLLTNGRSTLAEARANANGEFALDLALPAGEHRLRLAQAGEDGSAPALSKEAALVSVPPKGRANELLVMMERPGLPSEILVRPAVPQQDVAALQPAPGPQAEDAPQAAGAVPSAGAPGVSAPATDPAGTGASASLSPGAPGPDVGAAARQSRMPAPRAAGDLAVEAVEIENGKLFIAGAANPKSTIRIYLDDVFVTEATGGAGERFIASAVADVPVGDHVIRADEVGAGGVVVSRVEVPFNRPDGSAMSAIASAEPRTGAEPAPSPSVEASADGASVAAAGDTPAGLRGSLGPGAAGSGDAGATGGSPTAMAAAQGDASSSSSQVADGGLRTTVQAPLETVQSRVIIRRGDTLWRISRETYGRGARYTVIYLANGDQIRDPDRIYPGQVFRMPKDEEASETRG